MYGCESWTIRKAECQRIACFWTVVLDRTLDRPLDCKEIKPVNPKGNKPWIFIGRTDAEAEVPVLWPPDVKNWLIGKDSGAGKDIRQEKGRTEDEMIGWHHWLNEHEFEQASGDGERQGSLACCSPLGGKELDTTELLNNNLKYSSLSVDPEGKGPQELLRLAINTFLPHLPSLVNTPWSEFLLHDFNETAFLKDISILHQVKCRVQTFSLHLIYFNSIW